MSLVTSVTVPDFESRLQAVESRIQRAVDRTGRNRADVSVVAVSKKFSVPYLCGAYQAGVRVFGENYVQEFADKKPELAGFQDAKFHLIGHLQSNKAKLACELFDVIQTVDGIRLLRRLDEAAAKRERLEVLLEVKLSEEENKKGAAPEELPGVLEAAQQCPNVFVTGLMTMPPWSDDPEHSRPFFKRLAELARQLGLPKLSMGMSGDLEVAIEEGATIVRVGTALFGPRPKPQPGTVAIA